MKKLFFKISPAIIAVALVSIYFLPNLVLGKFPIPADSLIGLYHPWRDISFLGYSPGRFPVKNPLITDPVLQTYPWRYLVIKNIKDFQLPLWNPYSFSGQPLLANIQSGPFQIINLLFFFLPFKASWIISVMLPMLLTSLFMYFFLRSYKLSGIASVFGSFVLPGSGFFVSWQTWGTIVTTAMWLPLILLSIRKVFQKANPIWILILIFSVSQSIFSGHWQTAFYVFCAAFIFLIFEFMMKKDLQLLIRTIFALSMAVLLSAIVILPSLEFIKYSARSTDQGYSEGRKDWFLPVQNLIQIVAPDFFGNPTTYNYWGIWNYAEFVSFIGIVPLAFAISSLGKKRDKIFFILLAGLSLLLALSNPLSKIPYSLNFPFISSVQPSRIIFLLVFALSGLSAFGLDDFLKKSSKRLLVATFTLLIFLAILLLVTKTQKEIFPITSNIDSSYTAYRNLLFPTLTAIFFMIVVSAYFLLKNKKAFIILVFVITFLDLYRFYQKFTPYSNTSLIFPQTQILSFIEAQAKPFRVMTTDRRILNGNSSSAYSMETVQGYDPIYLKSYAKLVSSWDAQKLTEAGSFNRIITPQKFDSKIADFLNVKYLLTFDEINSPDFQKIQQEGETKLYENKKALVRAFFVKEVIKSENDNDQIEKLLSPDFDLRNYAVSNFSYQVPNLVSMANFKVYKDQYFALETSSNYQAPLVVSNVYYPGWKVYVDGKETTLNKANYMFQLAMIPGGNHLVEFKYLPQSFYNGLYLSLLGAFTSLAFYLYLWKKRFQ